MKKWLKCMPFLGLATLSTLTACNADSINWRDEVLGEAMVDPIDDNYRVFYQIFPGSFSDSNGDGVGDLQGIINRLDYLNDGNINSGKSLGVQGIWLNPIFKSPSYHKYDTSNYDEIDSSFGDLDTFKKLVDECHKRNIKIILDLVLNHTSTDHNWFKEFKKAQKNNDTTNKYYNYYSFYSYEDKNKATTEAIPGSANFYECNFSTNMPELNYDNPEVYTEMLNVAKKWIDNGVDGFRFDAAKYIYYENTEKNVEFFDKYIGDIKEYAKLTNGKDLYTVAEVWDSPAARKPYHQVVNTFDFKSAQAEGTIAVFCKKAKGNNYATNYVNELNSILEENPNGMHIPFLSNHDTDRSAGFLPLSKGYAQMGANLLILSSGSPFIYYGEEIGMKGSRGGSQTDANRRLAMLWGDGDSVKNPTGSDFKDSDQINGTVKDQVNSKSSLLTRYRKLIQIRNRYPEIARGKYEAISNQSDLAIFKVTYNGSTIYIIHNASTKDIDIDVTSYNVTELKEQIGDGESSLNNKNLTIGKQSSVILK